MRGMFPSLDRESGAEQYRLVVSKYCHSDQWARYQQLVITWSSLHRQPWHAPTVLCHCSQLHSSFTPTLNTIFTKVEHRRHQSPFQSFNTTQGWFITRQQLNPTPHHLALSWSFGSIDIKSYLRTANSGWQLKVYSNESMRGTRLQSLFLLQSGLGLSVIERLSHCCSVSRM